MSGDGDSRKRLRPWLEAKINSGTIPGLGWVDEEKTMFTIPWKHAGKQDWTPDQSVLFMEWAKHTGRYREGVDDLDYATWKTRLRCAFNKAPDIQEVKHMTDLDAVNPYRVYKLLPKKQTKRLPMDSPSTALRAVPKTEFNPTEYMQRHNLNVPAMEKLSAASATNAGGEQSMSVSGSIPSDLKSINSQDILRPVDGTAQLEQIKQEFAEGEQSMDCADGIGSASGMKSPYTTVQVADDTARFIDLSSLNDSLPSDSSVATLLDSSSGATFSDAGSVSESTLWFAQQSPQSQQGPGASPQHQPAIHAPQPVTTAPSAPGSGIPTTEYLQHNLPPQAAGVVYQQAAEQIELGSLPDKIFQADYPVSSFADQLQDNQMRITLRYTTNIVYDQLINGSTGCRMFHGADTEALGPPDMEQIELPPAPGNLGSNAHEVPTTQLLQNMGRGLLLQCRDGDIFANRLCNCKVFYSTYSTGNACDDIPREKATKIFDYNAFKSAVQAYRDGAGSVCPSSQVYLWFGQRVQPSPNLTSKVLISAAVFSLDAKQLEMNAENSFTSMLISKSDDGERLARAMRELSDNV